MDRWLERWWRIAPRGRPELRTTLTVLIGSGVAMLGSFATRVLMARALSPAELGLLLLAIAIASPLAGVLSLGLSQAAALVVADRRAAEDDAGARRAAASALVLAGVAGIGGVAVLGFASLPLARLFSEGAGVAELRSLLLAVSPIVATLPVGLAMLGVHRGFGGATARAVLRDGGGGLTRTLGVGLAALAGGGATALALGFALGVVVADVVYASYGVLRGWAGRLRGRLDREILGRIRGLAPLQLVTELRRWSDVLAVGLVLDARQVGLYGLARGFGRVLEAIQQAPSHSFLPTASTLDDEQLRPVHGRVRDLTLALVWIPAAFCVLSPTWVIVPFAGGEYRDAAPVLTWLALAVTIDVVWGFNHHVLLARRGERIALAVALLAIATTVVLVLLVAPRWGVGGAAAAVAASESVRVTLLALVLRRRGYRPPSVEPAALLAVAVLLAAGLWRWSAGIGDRTMGVVALVAAILGALVLGLRVVRSSETGTPDAESTMSGDR